MKFVLIILVVFTTNYIFANEIENSEVEKHFIFYRECECMIRSSFSLKLTQQVSARSHLTMREVQNEKYANFSKKKKCFRNF